MLIVLSLPLREMEAGMQNMDMEFGGRGMGGDKLAGAPTEDPFKVHLGIECDGCNKVPIMGNRYKFSNRANYDLCAECHAKPEKTEGMTFDEYEYVWSVDCKGDTAPSAPLSMGESGVKVLFLQKVLTDLGYMTREMYAWRAGVYRRRTKEAVEKFQSGFGLESAALKGVYDATTAASLESVVEGGMGCRMEESAGAGPSNAATSPDIQA